MSDKKFMNGKIRVVENIGEESENAFGLDGSVLAVNYGVFMDIEGFPWSRDRVGFENIKQVNEYFATADEYQTVFELVEDVE